MDPSDAPTSTDAVPDSQSEATNAADPLGFDTLYRRLRAICHHKLASERVDHTLQATALANEVFLKLLSRDEGKARNPAGATRWFIANAVVAIREVLVDHARARGREKRGGGWVRVGEGSAEDEFIAPPLDPEVAERIRTVDALLSDLAATSSVQADIVALRFFAGLTFGQIAEQLEMSETSVRREWVLARIWMGQRSGADGWEA
jgi:RNA polymerase sigma-70 factor, ECF subfamily